MTTTKQYDKLNRLLEIRHQGVGLSDSFAYAYNDANQRIRVAHADGSYWLYQYDTLGQVTSGKKYWPDGTPVAGQQFEYAFDDIGNRTQTKAGGDAWSAGLRPASYTNNLLNQITGRDVPGAVDILGIAHANATVTVNTEAPYRKGEYFHRAVSLNNTNAAVWAGLTNVAVLSSTTNTVTGNVFLPKTAEAFAYDADGNLTNDGRWTYTWDAENRLVKMVSRNDTPSNSWCWLEFAYDHQSRRVAKTVSNYVSGAWTLTNAQRFVYDGWNLLAELDALNPQQPTLIRSYTWGLDLSGTLQGAGGVGGLLAVSQISNGQVTNSHLVCYDGNGNVMALVNASNGTVSANYEYGPFAEPLRATGPMAQVNPIRFSTKFHDDESDLLYYGYRYYSPSTGRWLSRDPIGELGGRNLYAFVWNSPVNAHDPLGERPNWHHLLPQAPELAAFFAAAGIADINASDFGWVLDSECHLEKGGLHPAWNEEWVAFKDANPGAKKEAILAQLAKMKNDPRFKPLLDKGQQATLDYKAWKALRSKIARETVEASCKKCGKKVVKKVPVLGLVFWASDVNAKGPVAGTCNTVLDACPVVGWIKLTELLTGDWIPDKKSE